MSTIRELALVLFVVCVVFSACAQAQPPQAGEQAGVVKGNNAFALELYGKVREKAGDSTNIFFSPYSISTALAMTYAGAQGETAAQMSKVLHFDLVFGKFHPQMGELINGLNEKGKKGAYELVVANALWGQKGYTFLKEFMDLTQRSYKAGLQEVDFAADTEGARKTINAWVEEQTRKKIVDLIGRGVLTPLSRLVLTNAIYFKSNWASVFEPRATRDAPFTLLDGKKIDVPMMSQLKFFRYGETNETQVLELPYRQNELSMIIFLPKDAGPQGLPNFEKSLSVEKLADLTSQLKSAQVDVQVPKFKTTYGLLLGQTLRGMGITDAFVYRKADFSGMDGTRELFISEVIHKAYVDVNESGTEAAAATAVVMAMGAAPSRQPPVLFRADHPFVYLIRDNNSGSILFLGRLANPKQQ